MSSNLGNKEAGQRTAEEKAQEQVKAQHAEVPDRQDGDDIRVTDKRRATSDGPSGSIDNEDETSSDSSGTETEPSAVDSSEIELLEARLKTAEERRAEAERQAQEFSERFRHAQAQLKLEAEEQRARMQRSFDQKLDMARGDIIASLLDTLDNLKRAIAAAEKSEKRGSDFDALLEGVRATASLFESKMQSFGLTPIECVGQEFNPELHEAVEIVSVPAARDNRVIDEFQTGYKFGERLLRPARVRVGRAD
jgi:molecular chaperone GrpE